MELEDFSMPVHKSFHQETLIMGLQKPVWLILFMLFFLVSSFLPYAVAGIITAALYIPCYFMTKKDPHMIIIALENLTEPDILEG